MHTKMFEYTVVQVTIKSALKVTINVNPLIRLFLYVL